MLGSKVTRAETTKKKEHRRFVVKHQTMDAAAAAVGALCKAIDSGLISLHRGEC